MRKYLLGLALGIILLTATVFATDDDVLAKVADTSGVAREIPSAYNTTLDSDDWKRYIRYESSDTSVYLSSTFEYISVADKIAVVQGFSDDLYRWDSVPMETRQSLYTGLRNNVPDEALRALPVVADAITADIQSAWVHFQPFKGIVGTLLGVLSVMLVLLLMFSTLSDLFHLGNDTLMQRALDAKSEGKPYYLASTDAVKAAKEIAQGSDTHIYWAYIRLRWVTFVVLFVCILYLIQGQIGSLLGSIFDMLSGVT